MVDMNNMNNKCNLSIYDITYINENNDNIFLPLLLDECLMSSNSCTSYLLNKEKKIYDFMEKMVYDMSQFHLKTMNLDISSKDIIIEFGFKTIETCKSQMHTVCDENSAIIRKISPIPIFTSFLYLNDNMNPTIITNIDEESYKYKKFINENSNIFLIFPKKMRNIVFNSGYFHGEINIFDEFKEQPVNIFVVNVWKKYCPLNIPIYETRKYENYLFDNTIDSLIRINRDIFINKINIDNKLYLDVFFTEILYGNNKKTLYELKPVLENEYMNNDKILLCNYNSIEPGVIEDKDKDKYIKKTKFNKNFINFEKITILSNFIDEEQIKTIKTLITGFGVLNNESELFVYIKNNVLVKLYKFIVDTYKLNEEHNININSINLSPDISYNNNNSCIAVIFINDDIIKMYGSDEEININSKSIILKRGKFTNTNTNKNQILIEFLIDIY